MMTSTSNQTLCVSGLYYEELVLLQELMVLIDTTDFSDHPVLIDNRPTFNSLFDKVMQS